MFSSIGWTEMLVIAVIAIIFVGPKDLPSMLRQFGRFSRKVRSVAGDFQKQVDDALRESELDSVRDSINEVRSLDPRKAVADRLNPLRADIEADPNAQPAEQPVFDEDAGPAAPEPVKVDVDAALARQAALDEELAAAKEPAAKKVSKRKPAAKAAAKPSAKKPAAKPAARKPAAKKTTKKSASKASA